MMIPTSKLGTFSSPVKDWIRYKLSFSQLSHLNIPWGVLFAFAIWNLWKNRNSLLFSSKPLHSNLIEHTIHVSAEFYASQPISTATSSSSIQVNWEPPPDGFHKLNSDGCSKGNPGIAEEWGLIRDSLSRWVRDYQMNLGSIRSLAAELKALRQGLIVTQQCGVRCLIVELDAKLILSWVWGNSSNKVLTNLIDDCRTLCCNFEAIIPRHNYRDAKKCADHLTNLGVELPHELVILPHPPSSIRKLLLEDLMGHTTPRFVSTSCTND
ncbi:hypothetical protein CRG98_005876 [Punica granatum]|uniref:RNase H type-1 domain-containing protein n=1 Tax=Punica granatum TaxID=22663 RepID=A0A2I0KZ22_PUNGR|nr:hypothetical protein CRG98_005876 [Punica granatum]